MITFPNVKGIMTIRTQNGRINGHNDYEIPDDVTGHDCMLMSESSLAKLWDTPEEDAAWGEL